MISFPWRHMPAGHENGEDPYVEWSSRCMPEVPMPAYLVVIIFAAVVGSTIGIAVLGCWGLSELLLWADNKRAIQGYAFFDEDTWDRWESCLESLLRSVPCIMLGRLTDRLRLVYEEWATQFKGVRRPEWLLWLDDRCADFADSPVGHAAAAFGRWFHEFIYGFRCMEVSRGRGEARAWRPPWHRALGKQKRSSLLRSGPKAHRQHLALTPLSTLAPFPPSVAYRLSSCASAPPTSPNGCSRIRPPS